MVRVASEIEAAWLEELFPHQLRRERTVEYDPQRGRAVARSAVYYRDLLLREERDAPVDAVQASAALANAVRPQALEIFQSDDRASELLARIELLRRHMPEHPWPALGPKDLGELLASVLAGKRSIDEVRRSDLTGLLAGQLPDPLDRLLNQHAPETLTVPSGSQIRLTYIKGERPLLAARLQELFGWTDTPRIAAGKVPVVLHLLAPNFRPVQITDDLRSFWATTYFQVRKDLRVRYPKHAWPEDPLTAKPQAKGGRARR
jgi:ATP-dependent helicase HrpB